VLVDSEALAHRVLCTSLAEQGLEVPLAEAVRMFKGRTFAECLARAGERLGRPLDPDFAVRHRQRLFAAFERELRPVPGVREALLALPVPRCVASSSDPERLKLSLGVTGLLPLFEGRVFSAVEVARPKPWPDLFCHAARHAGVEPEKCLVVEDSDLGVQAARAAGMRALGFAGTELADAAALERAGAVVFHDMRELPELVRS
jgi:HAD superfamily hydrolase (TIGR01509 family)